MNDGHILYIDCFSGVSGDKFLSALFNLDIIKIGHLNDAVDMLNISSFSYKDVSFENVSRKGISGLLFHIRQDKLSIKFKTLSEINHQIELSGFKPEIKNDIHLIYHKLFEAESSIHGKSFDDLHLHELATIDTIVDISLSAFLVNQLKVNNIVCSFVNLGSGIIDAAHGKFSVPAPAVSFILKEVPVYCAGNSEELTTPTGAALIKYYAKSFSEKLPAMEIISEGYGSGLKDLSKMANILRVFYGRSIISKDFKNNLNYEEIYEITSNIDDMNPEIYDYVIERLISGGALDVFLTPVIMKKNRPGVLLTVLCGPAMVKKLSNIILEETTSIGLRISKRDKVFVERYTEDLITPFGKVSLKISAMNGCILNKKPEYNDLKKIANSRKIPLKEVYRLVYDIIKYE
jgi:hypothetical protein